MVAWCQIDVLEKCMFIQIVMFECVNIRNLDTLSWEIYTRQGPWNFYSYLYFYGKRLLFRWNIFF